MFGIWCESTQGDQTPSLLSDHWPDCMNNDSSGCVLQDCCIVLTGKPLLLLLAAALLRKSVVTWNLLQNYGSISMSGSFGWANCVRDNLWCAAKGKYRSKVFCEKKKSLHDSEPESPYLATSKYTQTFQLALDYTLGAYLELELMARSSRRNSSS